MLFGELHVPQVLGVTALVSNAKLGVGLPRRVTVVLTALVVSGVILRLGHPETA